MKVFLSTIAFFFVLTFLLFSCAGSRPDRSYLRNQNITCNNIISVAQPWMGAPYKFGGTSYDGVDCSGLVKSIFKDVFNIDLPRTTALMYQQGIFVRQGLQCGDLVFFKNIAGRGGVDHVGIYVGNDRFIHASTSQGVVISELSSDYYSSHYVSARRY